MVFETIEKTGDHEEVVYCYDKDAGLKAIIAIHNTALGPALGGTRLWPYASDEEAVEDVLRLSKGMTYKAAVSGLNLGGGKAVIIADPKKDKSEALFRAYGRFIESLNGRYITAQDVNVSVDDIDHIYTETHYVCGIAKASGGAGNPAPYTALGVFRGMEAAVTKVWQDKRELKGKKVAIQGVGSVGRELAKLVDHAGGKIFFTDISQENIDLLKEQVPSAEFVGADDIYDIDMDIYAPCALGATLNDATISRLKCKIVSGAANNQLAEDTSIHERLYEERFDSAKLEAYLAPLWQDEQAGQQDDSASTTVYDVVGPICESADVVGHDRAFKGLKAGDLLAVMDSGAYGRVMMNDYNSHRRPQELFVEKGKLLSV